MICPFPSLDIIFFTLVYFFGLVSFQLSYVLLNNNNNDKTKKRERKNPMKVLKGYWDPVWCIDFYVVNVKKGKKKVICDMRHRWQRNPIHTHIEKKRKRERKAQKHICSLIFRIIVILQQLFFFLFLLLLLFLCCKLIITSSFF